MCSQGGQARDGFHEDYFERLFNLEERSFWFRSRNRLILWAFSRYFGRARNFLEIGSGTGFVSQGIARAFPDVSVTAAELFTAGLAFASRRIRSATFLQADARRLPFDQEFDVAGAFDVLEHIEQDTAVIHELARALTPGGGLLLTVPQHSFLWSRQDEYACHVRRYERGELEAKLQHAGFDVELSTSFVSLLLPALFASRAFNWLASRPRDELAELRLPRFLDFTFERIMKLEARLVYAGIRLPYGGSLLVAARKR
jgi:SAM-dependent methyltransferase